ncbi:MAG: tetratricopeptide repeat protein [bacterium]
MARKRMSRKELKKPDRVLSTMEKGVSQLNEHRKLILIGVIVVVVGVALGIAYKVRTDSQAEKAAELFKKGTRIYTALIDPSLATDRSGKSGEQGQAFRDRATRAKAALRVFSKIVNEFEGYPIARAAHLYRGNCLFDLRKFGEAVTAYKKVLSTKPAGGCMGCGGEGGTADSLRALAMENLGYALAAKGKLDEARQTFARLRSIDKGTRRDWAYYHEALLREQKGDFPGAIKAYEMVRQTGRSSKGQNPDLTFMLSPLNELSTKRARYLKMKLADLKQGSSKAGVIPPMRPAVKRPAPDAPDMGAAVMSAPAMGVPAMGAPAMGAPAMGAAPVKPAPVMRRAPAMTPAPVMGRPN